jgi:uncharacterized protein YfiM (DUF2279 family)
LVAELHALISAGNPICLFSAGYDISISTRHSSFNSSNFSFSFSSLVLVSSGLVVSAQAGVSLVEDDISHITDKVINSQALEEDADEVNWQRT